MKENRCILILIVASGRVAYKVYLSASACCNSLLERFLCCLPDGRFLAVSYLWEGPAAAWATSCRSSADHITCFPAMADQTSCLHYLGQLNITPNPGTAFSRNYAPEALACSTVSQWIGPSLGQHGMDAERVRLDSCCPSTHTVLEVQGEGEGFRRT